MRFTWSTKCDCNNIKNVISNYKKISQDFCSHYYPLYDKNYPSLGYLYKPNSMFTFIDSNVTGFKNLCNIIQSKGIYKITHHTINVCAQPLWDINGILIAVNGTLSINNNFSKSNFTETILLKKDSGNKFHIYQTIFNIQQNNTNFVNNDMDFMNILDDDYLF